MKDKGNIRALSGLGVEEFEMEEQRIQKCKVLEKRKSAYFTTFVRGHKCIGVFSLPCLVKVP